MSETNKAIAKRLKNKGLQRLRWYCQMCQKQCRDENGFKNHCTTENHLRNMERFSSDADKYVESFSRDFEKAFLDVLSHHHHTKRMNANYVYNEMIQDKNHVHMNATRWDSLASFVKHLAATGKCEIDETERGWFVRWIDPEEKAREAGRRRRDEEEARLLEQRTRALLKRQHEMSETADVPGEDRAGATDYIVEDAPVDDKLVFAAMNKKQKTSGPSSVFTINSEEEESEKPAGSVTAPEDEQTTTWLMSDIVVRITSSKVGTGLKNEKAVVLDVHDDAADLIMLKTAAEVPNVPSKRLETVIPNIGGRVMVLGLHPKRGNTGTVQGLNQEDCTATVKLSNGEVTKFEFEDISKLFEEAASDN